MSQAEKMFWDHEIYKYFRDHEEDGQIDFPARRTIWNDWIDAMVKDGALPSSAYDEGIPDHIEDKKFPWNWTPPHFR